MGWMLLVPENFHIKGNSTNGRATLNVNFIRSILIREQVDTGIA